ncbi:hypothetical protein ACQ4PT_000762 [Festuca glaucescens]
MCRWPAPASLDFRLAPHDSPQPLLESLERRGRRRLDRFSLSLQTGQLNDEDFDRCLDYAAACAVADLDVHLSNSWSSTSPTRTLRLQVSNRFRLPPGGNPHLARLSPSGTGVDYFQHHHHPYPVLEVTYLHRVTISDATLINLLAAARPLLRTLDIRYCRDLSWVNLAMAGANLKNVTVVECECLTDVLIHSSSSLRSFRYSGAYLAADVIPTGSAIDDLYICFEGPACRRLRPRWAVYDEHNRPGKLRRYWLDKLINVSNLTVLTLCSSALRRLSAKARARSAAGNAPSCKLQNLREVQLLMFAMYDGNLDDIMDFLMTCCTPRLERLFVQLPTRCDQYKPDEEPSESEEELSEVETAEEDLSKGEGSEEDQSAQYESEEGSEVDHANEDESDEDEEDHSQGDSEENHSEEDHLEEDHSEEDESEEDHSQESDSEENHSEEDDSEEYHSEEDESEEDHSQESDSEENHSQEGESEEEGSDEGHPKEDGSEEQGFAQGQSKEDGSKREFSNGGQPVDETQNGCENLMLLKMTNFMGHHNEMRLVSFVLKKCACLNQLMLFTPESDHPGGPQKDHLNTSDFLETKLLSLEKASPNAQIILSGPDAAAIKPLHWETFVKV